MTTLTRGCAALLCSLLLSTPLVSYAQLGLPVGGGAGAPGGAPDLSCSGRGTEGKLACGDIGLEETMDFCEDVDGDYVCDKKDECPDTPEGLPVFMNGCHEMELSEDRPWVLRGVNFEFDKAVLREESIPILDAAVNVLNEHPELLVAIDGHTDSKGSDFYNENLSRDRAKAVHDYFIDRGVKTDRLVYRGFGESRPIAPNSFDDGSDNPEGRFENRRVELNVLDMETFNAVKAEIAERRAELEAERARRAAAKAKAAAEAAKAAEEEADEEAEQEAEEKSEEKEKEADKSESSSDEFDASQYLDFTEEEGDTGTATDDNTGTTSSEATESESGSAAPDDSKSSESSSDSSSDFDESEYLEFLESDSSGDEESTENTENTENNE